MNNDTRAERCLLEALDEVGKYALPKKTLLAEVNTRMPTNGVLTGSDFDALLARLEQKGRIRAVTGEDGVTVMITENGRHRLAELSMR